MSFFNLLKMICDMTIELKLWQIALSMFIALIVNDIFKWLMSK